MLNQNMCHDKYVTIWSSWFHSENRKQAADRCYVWLGHMLREVKEVFLAASEPCWDDYRD